jgi:hypothetical protein
MGIEIREETLIWLLSDDTGLSSKTLCSCLYLAPTKKDKINYPRDTSDFGRCKRFLETLTPEDKEKALQNVSKVSREWKALTENWNRLEMIYEHNNMLSKEMDKLIQGAKNVQ